MPEFGHNELSDQLSRIVGRSGTGELPAAYIIFGEEMLCKQMFSRILDTLLPEPDRMLKHEPFDGADSSLFDVLERVNTYSLMSTAKVVSLKDARLFDASQDPKRFAAEAAAAFDQQKMKKAAGQFLRFLAASGIPLEDARSDDYAAETKPLRDGRDDSGRIVELVDYCKTNDMKVKPVRDEGAVFLKALKKGFPKGHYLLITTDVMDRRKKIYKELKEVSVVVNCAVPRGDRQADRSEQEKVIGRSIRPALDQSGKTLDGAAFRLMFELIGFDLRTFVSSVEKLISYSGKKERIGVSDVRALLQKTRQDPIYALSNAVAERRADRALFFIDSLLAEKGNHPLMILAVLVNQVRKLLLVKGFLESEDGRSWHTGISFDRFKTDVFPAVKGHDEKLQKMLSVWQEGIHLPEGKTGGRSKKVATDVGLVRGSGSPYPVYQQFIRAANYSRRELRAALAHLAEVDYMMKSSSRNPRILLERAVISILSDGQV